MSRLDEHDFLVFHPMLAGALLPAPYDVYGVPSSRESIQEVMPCQLRLPPCCLRLDSFFLLHFRRAIRYAHSEEKRPVLATWAICSQPRHLPMTSSTSHTPYRLIGYAILPSNLTERFSLFNSVKDSRPFRWGYLPMRITWTCTMLGRSDKQRISQSFFKRIIRRIW